MIPSDEPLMQHYLAEVVLLRPAPSHLPPINRAAVRSFNEHLRRIADDAPELATAYAGFGFEKACEHCAADLALLEETAELLLRLFLSHDKPISLRAVVRAVEEVAVGSPEDQYGVYMRAAVSSEAALDQGFGDHCRTAALRNAELMCRENWANWQPLAQALLLMAGARQEADSRAGATDAVDRAIELCRLHVGEPQSLSLMAWALSEQGRLLLEVGDLGEARRVLDECELLLHRVIDEVKEPWAAERMSHVLLHQSELLQRTDEHEAARQKLARAVGISERGPMMLEAMCRSHLAKLLIETGHQAAAAHVLFVLSGTYLMWAAALAGAEDVAEFAKVEAEDEGSHWVADSRPEMGHLTFYECCLRDAERLLNVSPDLQAERMRGLELSLSRAPSDDPERNPEQTRRLLQAWRALALIRRIAIDACRNRAELQPGWENDFPERPLLFGNCRFTVQPVGRPVGEQSTAHRVMVEVAPASECQVDPIPERMAGLVDAVARLQGRLCALPKVGERRAARRVVLWSFTFRSLSCEEALSLQSFHDQARLSKYRLRVAMHPHGLALWDARGDGEMKSELQTEGRCDLIVGQKGSQAAGDHLFARVAQVLEFLMDSLTKGTPTLRCCQTPRSQRAYLQWRLGERTDLPVCGQFYFPTYGPRQACNETHSNIISKLRNDTNGQLWEEARSIAFREFMRFGTSGDALSSWRRAISAHPTDPAQALQSFRRMMGAVSE